MKGYKVFNSDWTCRGFQYKVGGTYKHEGEMEICKAGFHFCKQLVDCFNYYSFNPKNKVAIIEATGEVIEESNVLSSGKCVTNEIKIVKELSWYEVLNIVNTGEGNTGVKNTGNCNTGRDNNGNWNTGNHNSGNNNTGDYNSGSYNSGNGNSGYGNSGRYNSGAGNTGDCNSGDCNSGSYNSSYGNSGYGNTGYYNSGNYNSGDCNAGHCNRGDYNTGNYNRGNYNIGDCNLGNKKLRCFCTNDDKQEYIKLFNKESDWTLDTWKNSRVYKILNNYFELTMWINERDMTDEEKEKYSEYKATGGYLKELSYIEAWRNMWNNIDNTEKEAFVLLPNFDKDIFKAITGIDIEEKLRKVNKNN